MFEQKEYSALDFFTIEELRNHLRVYHEDDDEEIKMLAEAAIEVAAGYVGGDIIKKGMSLKDYLEENVIPYTTDSTGVVYFSNQYWLLPFNKRIRSAVLLCTADLYENREANTDYSTYENRAFSLLLNGMRNINIRQV